MIVQETTKAEGYKRGSEQKKKTDFSKDFFQYHHHLLSKIFMTSSASKIKTRF